MSMKVDRTNVLDVLTVIPKRFGDERGFFCESYSKRRFEDIGKTLACRSILCRTITRSVQVRALCGAFTFRHLRMRRQNWCVAGVGVFWMWR